MIHPVFIISTGYYPHMVKIKNKRGIEKIKPKQIIAYNENMSGIGSTQPNAIILFQFQKNHKMVQISNVPFQWRIYGGGDMGDRSPPLAFFFLVCTHRP